jgi:hypothetical protein
LKAVSRFLSSRARVCDDWIAVLPHDKLRVFDEAMRQLEAAYAMLSIALDEAFTLRREGRLILARQHTAISSELMALLAGALVPALNAIDEQARHLSALPAVEPLNLLFFRGAMAQEAASWNSLLLRVLFGDRTRFFHKLHALTGILEDLAKEFVQTADEVSEAASIQPEESWAAMECLHYDVNTCLREAQVILKSFLRALPSQQLGAFEERLRTPRPASTFRLQLRFSRTLD